MVTVDDTAGLARRAIGLREVLFQSVTHMAPAAAVAFSVVLAAPYAGGALTLSVIFAVVACVLVANSIAQMSRHLPSAGGFYTYAARGLHPAVGFLVGWGYALAEATVVPFTALSSGVLLAGVLQTSFGWAYNPIVVITAALTAILVFALGWYGVGISTRTGTILGASEIVVFLLLAVWLIVEAGHANTAAVFTTKYATVKGYIGVPGIIAGTVYAIFACIGFEAAAPLAEEADNPRETVPRAVLYSIIGIGVFLVFTTYAGTVFFGPRNMGSFAQFGGGSPWVELAKRVWGPVWFIAFIAILNSNTAAANAGSNAATRTWFAMGRIKLLPSLLARTHPTRRSPYLAVILQLVVTVGVALWLGLAFGPVTAFTLLATLLTVVVVAIYMVTNLACIVYFWRWHRSEFNPILQGVLPLVGIAAFVPVMAATAGIGHQFFSFVSALPYPISLIGPVVGVWYLLGVVYLVYLWRSHPERIEETAWVFVDPDEQEEQELRRRQEALTETSRP